MRDGIGGVVEHNRNARGRLLRRSRGCDASRYDHLDIRAGEVGRRLRQRLRAFVGAYDQLHLLCAAPAGLAEAPTQRQGVIADEVEEIARIAVKEAADR
jgi:hypothetical protein